MTDQPATTKAQMVEALHAIDCALDRYAAGTAGGRAVDYAMHAARDLASRLPDAPPAGEREPKLETLRSYVKSDAFKVRMRRTINGALDSAESEHGVKFRGSAIKRVDGQVRGLILNHLLATAPLREDGGDTATSVSYQETQDAQTPLRDSGGAADGLGCKPQRNAGMANPPVANPEREPFDAGRVQQEPDCSHSKARAVELTSAAEARPAFDEVVFWRACQQISGYALAHDAISRLASALFARGASMDEIVRAAVGGGE